MEAKKEDNRPFAECVKVLGVHKQENRGISHFFIVMVTWSDKSQVTIYRKWSQIRSFQAELIRALKNDEESRESRRFLKKTARNVFRKARSSPGTMRKLRMIDSLNHFFSTVTHYKSLAQSNVVHFFLKPSETDITSPSWTQSGRTYLYVSRDVLGDRKAKNEYDPLNKDDREGIRLDSNGDDSRESDTGYETASQPSSISDSTIFIAIANYDGELTESTKSVISLRKHDKVDVLEQNESGWWLVKVASESCESDVEKQGYVPASYLSQLSRDNSFESAFSTDKSDQSTCSGPITITINDEELREISENAFENNEFQTAPKKSLLNKIRNEYSFEASDSELSTCSSNFSSCSDEIEEIKDQLADLAHSPASSSPYFRRRSYALPSERYVQTGRRNTLPILDSAGSSPSLLKVATIQRSSTFNSTLVPGGSLSNLYRSSSLFSVDLRTKGEDYISKQSYDATSAEELSFKEGSVVKVIRRNSDGWWLACYQGKTGLVPGVHLTKYKDPIRRMSLQMLNMM